MTHGSILTLTLTTLVLLLGVAPGTAQAHSKLISTSPADGAVLTAPPDEVVLTFDENLLQGTNTISVNDDLGNVIITTSAEPHGSTIRAPWPADLPPGTYQVAYRIVSADGRPVTGAFAFELAGGTACGGDPWPGERPNGDGDGHGQGRLAGSRGKLTGTGDARRNVASCHRRSHSRPDSRRGHRIPAPTRYLRE